jgi:hypothetical protein
MDREILSFISLLQHKHYYIVFFGTIFPFARALLIKATFEFGDDFPLVGFTAVKFQTEVSESNVT